MEKKTIKPFNVKVQAEKDYYRLYITHSSFKGRVRKRLGDRPYEDLETIAFNLKFELGKHFSSQNITKEEVESFIDNYVSMNVKCNASIFDYKADFLEYKGGLTNKKIRKKLSRSTISGYRTALKYFEEYLTKKRISPHPSQITETVLNNFYHFIKGSHNYRTKLHTKLKGFIKYIEEVKHLPVDPSYKLSVFTEEYDNQCPEDNDIALSREDVRKLIELRQKFQKGEIQLERYNKSEKIPAELQEHQFNMKLENIIKCLDCFLLMVSTGMYYADVMKSQLNFSKSGDITLVRYRRAKNGSLCRTIPIINDDIFIGEEIVNQYKIKNGSNFPLNLSLTHFDKHLGRISHLAGIGFKITNKMARKTFASHLYFNDKIPMPFLQILLGHKDVADTAHYLRISDDDAVNAIMMWKNRS
jgi:site-specific recombinase XerD